MRALTFKGIVAARFTGGNGKIICIAGDHSLHPPGRLPDGIRLNQLLRYPSLQTFIQI